MTQGDENDTAPDSNQAERTLGKVNVHGHWQIRIDWHCEPPMIWPPFTHDCRGSRLEAEDIACRALGYRKDPKLYVTGAFLRGPGESTSQRIALPQTVPT